MIKPFINARIVGIKKNKKKILILCVCCFILLFVVLRETSLYCCSKSDHPSVFMQLLNYKIHGRTMDTDSETFPKCSLHAHENIDCTKLIIGNKNEYDQAKSDIQQEKDNECQLKYLVDNCRRLKTFHHYTTDAKSISPDELAFPLAFTIKMHKNPEQAGQLLRTIYRPHNVYCIYVDKKSDDDVFDMMKKIGDCFENVIVVENRINMVYSSINLVHAELECMRILTKASKSWKYYINLTGQEYPLKTNFEIIKILQTLNGSNDIESYHFPFTYQQRYTKKYIIRDNAIRKTKQMKQSFIKRFQMSKGSAYGTFSRPFIEFILTDEIAGKFLLWLNGTYAPEEIAWATLNSLPWAPGGYPIETKHSTKSFFSRAVIWSWDGIKCHGHFVRGICIYESADLPWLVSRSELFANKFDLDTDPIVVECLEEILQNRTRDNKYENLNWYFYNTLPQVQYYGKIKQVQKSARYLQRKKDIWLREHNITLEQIKNLKF